MPTTKQITEYDYHEFEKLAIETLGLPPDYSVVASEEWSNDSDHILAIGPLAELLDFEREEMAEIYEAAAAYQAAVAANGGVDPYATFRIGRVESEPVKAARVRVHKATRWGVYRVSMCLVERGALTPGEYNIAVCW